MTNISLYKTGLLKKQYEINYLWYLYDTFKWCHGWFFVGPKPIHKYRSILSQSNNKDIDVLTTRCIPPITRLSLCFFYTQLLTYTGTLYRVSVLRACFYIWLNERKNYMWNISVARSTIFKRSCCYFSYTLFVRIILVSSLLCYLFAWFIINIFRMYIYIYILGIWVSVGVAIEYSTFHSSAFSG